MELQGILEINMPENKVGKGPIKLNIPYRNIQAVPISRLIHDRELFDANTNERLDYSVAIAEITKELERRNA
jgi:hypothetical protein